MPAPARVAWLGQRLRPSRRPSSAMRWATLACLLTALNAQADLFSGKGLLGLVNSGQPNQYAQFAGYVAGVQDMHLAGAGTGVVCIPRNIRLTQTMKSVEQFLSANPARLHEPARVLVADALEAIYPCATAP
jgi:hypothetical protein